MRKETICSECNNISVVDHYCDTCESALTIEGHYTYELGKPTTIELKINETYYEFCNWKCLLDFILKEIKKENIK